MMIPFWIQVKSMVRALRSVPSVESISVFLSWQGGAEDKRFTMARLRQIADFSGPPAEHHELMGIEAMLFVWEGRRR